MTRLHFTRIAMAAVLFSVAACAGAPKHDPEAMAAAPSPAEAELAAAEEAMEPAEPATSPTQLAALGLRGLSAPTATDAAAEVAPAPTPVAPATPTAAEPMQMADASDPVPGAQAEFQAYLDALAGVSARGDEPEVEVLGGQSDALPALLAAETERYSAEPAAPQREAEQPGAEMAGGESDAMPALLPDGSSADGASAAEGMALAETEMNEDAPSGDDEELTELLAMLAATTEPAAESGAEPVAEPVEAAPEMTAHAAAAAPMDDAAPMRVANTSGPDWYGHLPDAKAEADEPAAPAATYSIAGDSYADTPKKPSQAAYVSPTARVQTLEDILAPCEGEPVRDGGVIFVPACDR